MSNMASIERDDLCAAGSTGAPAGEASWLARVLRLLPSAAWSRISVLFFALVAIKLLMLVGMAKHLEEIHWRVEGVVLNWVNYTTFYGFILLGVLSVLGLARQCREIGVTAVRAANCAILLLGLLFIFL